jgi:hypothetical protein
MSAPAAAPRKNPNSLLKAGVTGSAVVLEMLSGGLAMENIKMEKQRSGLSYPEITRRVFRQGLAGVWAGFWPWGFALGMTKGSVLGGSRAWLLDFCRNSAGMDKQRADLVSGFGAGAVQGVFMSPVLLARTRVNQSLTERAAAGKINTGFVAEMRHSANILNDAVRKEGLGMLATGMPTMVAKRALDWGTRFIIIGKYKEAFQKMNGDKPLTPLQSLTASFLGGSTSCAITMPIDRMMPVLQQVRPDNVSMVGFLRQKLAEEGLATLQRGFAMRALHTGYHTMFAIFVADTIYQYAGFK